MREFFIDAGANSVELPRADDKINRVFLKGVRRPFLMTYLSPSAFDRLEKESFSNLMRGVPQWYTFKPDPRRIEILPRPSGKVTVMLEYGQELIPDGLDTTWKRTVSTR